MLSRRQQQVHDLILAGMSRRMIAEVLGISLGTVDTHGRKILDKLGLDSVRDICANVRIEYPGGLSQCQELVLRGIVQGKTSNAIAAEMNISPRTVQTHLTVLYKKLGVRGRHEACLLAQGKASPLKR